MTPVVLDTDTASQSLRRRLHPTMNARLAGRQWCVTFVTVGELTKWTRLRQWGPQRLAELADWMEHVTVLPYDEDVAVRWGVMTADAQLRGRSMPVNDSWIAACCLAHGLPLATLNTKDFQEIADAEGLELVGT
jgi:predicted nucleic acid-binding protein